MDRLANELAQSNKFIKFGGLFVRRKTERKARSEGKSLIIFLLKEISFINIYFE